MFTKKRLFVPSALILTSFFGVSEANAQDPAWDPACPYTLVSLQGSYAIIINYAADVALSLQAETLDGKGNLTRAGIINQPKAGSTTGERTVGTVSNTGTYTVNCNGTGTFSRIVTRPDGTTATGSDDFIITQAIQSPGQPPIATTIVDAQRSPSTILPGGVFLTRVHTRLPDIVPPTKASAAPKNATVTARQFTLDGTASFSADGKPLSYLWSIPQGSPSAAILGADTATPTVQFSPTRGLYTFQLTVTDSTGTSASDLAMVDFQGN